MTLLLDRDADAEGPRMHALVVGCGRFPWLPPSKDADRQAAYDSAVAMADFLLDHADRLEPRLATLDCLLADPSIDPEKGPDTFPARPDRGLPEAVAVDRPLADNFIEAIDALCGRCRKGDSLFLYFCSHGVAGREETGLLVLEDVARLKASRWRQVVDVKTLAQQLPAKVGAAHAWIFMDACQEAIPELKDRVGGIRGLDVVEVSSAQIARHDGQVLALCAGRYGQETFAPRAGGLGYFTRTLLDGLTSSCVDRSDMRWRISNMKLQYGLERVALAAGYGTIAYTPLLARSQPAFLMDVEEPTIPVHITSRPEWLLGNAERAVARGDHNGPSFAKAPAQEWRFRVPPHPVQYRIEIESNGTTVTKLFEISPPAVVEEIRNG